MPGGRPPKGPALVAGLEGTEGAKRKLEVILETLGGSKTIEEACAALGVKEAMFHRSRGATLQAALAGLEPKPMGRPRKAVEAEGSHVVELERENAELRRKLKEAEVREELMAALPSRRERVKEAGEKTKAGPMKR
jgi:hypothetical protein